MPNKPLLRPVLLLIVALLVYACAPQPAATLEPSETPTPSIETAAPPAPTHTAEPTWALPTLRPGSIKPVPTNASDQPMTGEAPPEVMTIVLADLEQRLGNKPTDVEVIRSEFVTWNDGALGCPQPGMYYTQATIDGYWIVLKVADTTYDYRVGNLQAAPLLCETQ